MDSCGEIALTPSATHGAVEEVERDEDGMGGGENKHLCSDHSGVGRAAGDEPLEGGAQ